ncbi:MAG: hypothetical protein ACK4QP_02735 [Pseudorhizobium sp.]
MPKRNVPRPAAVYGIDIGAARLSHDVVLVTYKSMREPTESQEGRQTLRSSIYRHQDGRWQMIFHQGTPIPLD